MKETINPREVKEKTKKKSLCEVKIAQASVANRKSRDRVARPAKQV